MTYININGKITTADQATLAPDNRAFRYGYGLFETMLYLDGALQLKERHFKRLFNGLQQLKVILPVFYTQARLEDNIARTVQRNNLSKCCRVRLQVYAGEGGLYEKDTHAGFVIECFPTDAPLALNTNGLVAGMATGLKKSTDSLSNLKAANGLIYAAAAQQAITHKWNDALILNINDSIIESTIANLFWIKDEVIYTPPLSDGCIAGVMREYIIDTLVGYAVQVQQKSLEANTLLQADELFLTNAIKKMRWVGNVGDKTYANTFTRHIWQKLFAS